mmetsp:Transcript_12172/g.21095  ORF Transcript_12172/g.21095 Transcript_12172/m.21095 type:complete len:214 (+) Transcript_12172:152-793(+)
MTQICSPDCDLLALALLDLALLDFEPPFEDFDFELFVPWVFVGEEVEPASTGAAVGSGVSTVGLYVGEPDTDEGEGESVATVGSGLGDTVGPSLGSDVTTMGAIVVTVGVRVGSVMGATVGPSLGPDVVITGAIVVTVGSRVGSGVGDTVGPLVGSSVGLRLGDLVGLSVGSVMGGTVGPSVGSDVVAQNTSSFGNCSQMADSIQGYTALMRV